MDSLVDKTDSVIKVDVGFLAVNNTKYIFESYYLNCVCAVSSWKQNGKTGSNIRIQELLLLLLFYRKLPIIPQNAP